MLRRTATFAKLAQPIIVVLVISGFFAVILFEAFATRSVVEVDPFIVPKEFAEQGFTSEVIVNRVVDQIANIEQVARAQTASRTEEFELTSPSPDIELEVSSTRVPIWPAVRFMQSVLHIEPLRVSGEITFGPASKSGQRHLSVTMRAVKKNVRRWVRLDAPYAEPDTAISPLAPQMLRLVDPHVLGIYVFAVQKDLKQALELSELAVQLDPNDSEAYVLWGAVLLLEHDIPGAIVKSEKAIALDRKSYEAHNNLGIAFLSMNDLDRAIPELKESIRIHPVVAGAYINLGVALDRKSDFDGAIANYKKAIALDPNSAANAYNGWGTALYSKGDYDGAVAKYQKAIALAAAYAAPYNGWRYSREVWK